MTTVAYDQGVYDVGLIGETIGGMLDRIAAEVPAREALVECSTGRRWTFASLVRDVNRLAVGLLDRGVTAGDRVGIWAPNCAEWVLVQYATAKVGAILVNINPAYRSHELRYALAQSGTSLLISAENFKSSDYVGMVNEVIDSLDGLDDVVYLGSEAWEALAWGGAADVAVSLGALAERSDTLSPDDPINIQYTSGTTGFPKGATLSHHNILNNGYFVGELCRYSQSDRVCVPVPFYHCFGMVMGNLGAHSHGACVVIPAPGFDPTATLAAVASEHCTSLYGVPTMFIAELALPDFASYDLSSLRTGIMAGAPCPVEVMKRVVDEMNMRDVTICYGMTETSPVSTQTRVDDDLSRRVSTVGRAAPHVEIKIIDPILGQTVERGVTGEFCTRGYSVMAGYWNEPERTAEAIDTSGWMHTGDLAVMDDDGYVSIVGRIKDMVIRGGENVYPREVEEVLYTHPDVADVAIIGVPDSKYGEELCAWVRPRPGTTPSADDIVAFSRDKVAYFKVPRYVLFVDEFPMTVTGKVQKFIMREQTIERLGL